MEKTGLQSKKLNAGPMTILGRRAYWQMQELDNRVAQRTVFSGEFPAVYDEIGEQVEAYRESETERLKTRPLGANYAENAAMMSEVRIQADRNADEFMTDLLKKLAAKKRAE